jgi:chaperonin GroES
MKIKAILDRVIVKQLEAESTTASGIILSGNEEKPLEGVIVSVGDGKNSPLSVKVGDKVIFGTYAGTSITFNGETLLAMREDDLIAVIEG